MWVSKAAVRRRGAIPEVAFVTEYSNQLRVLLRIFFDDKTRSIGGTITDDDDLALQSFGKGRRQCPVQQSANKFLFIEERDQNGYERLRHVRCGIR